MTEQSKNNELNSPSSTKLSLESPRVPSPKIQTKTKEQFCASCNKSSKNTQLFDHDGTTYCTDCLRKKLIPQLKRTVTTENEDRGAIISTETETSTQNEMLDGDDFFQNNLADNSAIKDRKDSTVSKLPKSADKETIEEVNTFIKTFSAQKKKEDNFMSEQLSKYYKDKQLDVLKHGLMDYPPSCNFIQMVIEYIIKQIKIKHPLLDRYGLDVNVDKTPLHEPNLKKMIKMIKYEFRIENTRVIARLLNSALLILQNLVNRIHDANLYDNSIDYWQNCVQGFLKSLHFRNNIFMEDFTIISHDPIELQKLFSAVQINLTPLAAVEMRITSNAKQEHAKAWSFLKPDDKEEFILSNFDTKMVMDLMPESKNDLFLKLLNDEDIKIKPEMMLALFSRFASDDRLKYLNLLRGVLYPHELETVVPALAKYRGKSLLEEK